MREVELPPDYPFRNVPYQHEVSKPLADLWGISTDLYSVVRYCERWMAEESKPSPDREVISALCEAAIVKYGRCLASGVRTGVSKEMIDGLSPELQEVHGFFKEARDKWVAHSVNVFENTLVQLVLRRDESDKHIEAVTVATASQGALSAEAANWLKKLARELQAVVTTELLKEQQQVLEHARQYEDIEQLYRRKMYVLEAGTDPSQVRKRSSPRSRATTRFKSSGGQTGGPV